LAATLSTWALLTLAVLAAGVASGVGVDLAVPLSGGPLRLAWTGGLLLVAVALAAALGGRQLRSHLGLVRPFDWRWTALLPVVVVAAAAGGAWIPVGGVTAVGVAVAVVLAACGWELLFRGVAYAILTAVYPVASGPSGQGLSVPTLVTAVLSAGAAVVLFQPPPWLGALGLEPVAAGLWPLACVVLALTCGAARERCRSVWPALLLHAAGALLAALGLGLALG
jgi:hypothetical protein